MTSNQRRGSSGSADTIDGFNSAALSTVSSETITPLTLSELPVNGYFDIGVRWRASDSSRNVLWKEITSSYKRINGVMSQVGLLIPGVDADEIVVAAPPTVVIVANRLVIQFTGRLNTPLTGLVQVWWAAAPF